MSGILGGAGSKSGVIGLTSASGGTEVTSGGYKYHKFTATVTNGFIVASQYINLEYLIVAGGGSGGASSFGGGGGAGGVLNGTLSVKHGLYTVTIGAGGSPNSNGNDSSIFGIEATGGGCGGTHNSVGVAGGSGGGAGGDDNHHGGPGIAGQGNSGGHGQDPSPEVSGGGGGAGSKAPDGGGNSAPSGFTAWPARYHCQGGQGAKYLVWANATSTGHGGYYGGGGGGGVGRNDLLGQGTGQGAYPGEGGGGGGGLGNNWGSGSANLWPEAGQANTGGGGGGGHPDNGTSGAGGQAGGSGIIIIRYLV